MARRPRELPATPPAGIFTLDEAKAAGISDSLRAPFAVPSRGLRIAPGTAPEVREILRCHAAVLPDDVAFARETAAHLHGLPIPLGVDPTRPIHTIRPTSTPPIRRRGVATHRGAESRDIVTIEGLRVTSPLDTWSDLALRWSRARTLALGDALLRVHGITPGEVSTHLSELDGRRGVRRLRELAPLLRPGPASPKESETRLLLHDHGLPEPELNGEIFDDWGTWIATSDFVWREPKVVGEYDGDQHRTDRTAWQYERARRARLEDCGWTYVELTQAHLSDLSLQGELLRRLRRLLC